MLLFGHKPDSTNKTGLKGQKYLTDIVETLYNPIIVISKGWYKKFPFHDTVDMAKVQPFNLLLWLFCHLEKPHSMFDFFHKVQLI